MNISIPAAARLLKENDCIVLLAHRKPDGDTLGSCFALLYALEILGKTARVECADGFPARYAFLYGDYVPRVFAPKLVVSVDVADHMLLGELVETYPLVHLCVDHHKSNTLYAQSTLMDAACPATAQIMHQVIVAMGVSVDRRIADCLFTGLTTDTGCFRYASVTADTHRLAAELISSGADYAEINKLMFDTKSRGRLEVEKLMMDSLVYYFEGKCAVVALPHNMKERFSVTDEELDGISSFSRRIEGVLAGITMREGPPGTYRVSLRSETPVDSSAICTVFGGGGHTGAAGCTMTGDFDVVLAQLLGSVQSELLRHSI